MQLPWFGTGALTRTRFNWNCNGSMPRSRGRRRVAARVGEARDVRGGAREMARVRACVALAVDDIHPIAIGAEGDVMWLVSGWNQTADAIRFPAGERNHRDRVRSAVDGVEGRAVAGERHRKRRGTGVLGAGQHAGRRAGIDPGRHRVARRIDDRDLIGIVLRDIESRLRFVEDHSESIAVQTDARDQAALGG